MHILQTDRTFNCIRLSIAPWIDSAWGLVLGRQALKVLTDHLSQFFVTIASRNFSKFMLEIRKTLALAVVALLIGQAQAADTQALTGAGSSAVAPIYRSGQTGFGASDVAPAAAELKKEGLVLFPIAITGIAPVVNLPKIGDGQLRLSSSVLGQIFLGEITQWNAPAIAQLNPEVTLPDLPIKVVVRSYGSGTT
jgi:ABC-type phosphate transport system substrate-binding protein